MKPKKIGCFEVTPLEPGRWRVKNTLTGHEHVTYGTPKELKVQLTQQTEAWERKLKTDGAMKGVKGAAWRKQHNAEWAQRKAAIAGAKEA
jgi:hypothetical protein